MEFHPWNTGSVLLLESTVSAVASRVVAFRVWNGGRCSGLLVGRGPLLVEIPELQLTEEEVKGASLDEEERCLDAASDSSLSSMQVTFPYCRGGSMTSRCPFVITALMQTGGCSSHSLLSPVSLHTP